MKVEVRGKEFEITFVNNYCRERYQAMLDSVDELTDLPAEVDELSADSSLSTAEKSAQLRALRKRQRALVHSISEARAEIVKELVETNGYTYDAAWWSRKTDADDMNSFALDCLQKDVGAVPASKKP